MPTATKATRAAKPARSKKPAPAAAAPVPVAVVHNPAVNPRELTAHRVGKLNEQLRILVRDEPSADGSNRHYEIAGEGPKGPVSVHLQFQQGPLQETGLNGITIETLIAVAQDKLTGFQNGRYADPNNAAAIGHLEAALVCLGRRQKSRAARGVEGTSKL